MSLSTMFYKRSVSIQLIFLSMTLWQGMSRIEMKLNWLSICEPCLQKTKSNENSFTCCFESCKSDQHDSCSTCKKSFCPEHISYHDCEVQPEVNTNNSIADDDKSLALQPKIDDGDKTIDDPDHMAIDDPDNMAVQPDVADDAQGLFRRRQDFLTSFLKTLTIEETGITVYNSYLFYFV
jgi:hypothetical protein